MKEKNPDLKKKKTKLSSTVKGEQGHEKVNWGRKTNHHSVKSE